LSKIIYRKRLEWVKRGLIVVLSSLFKIVGDTISFADSVIHFFAGILSDQVNLSDSVDCSRSCCQVCENCENCNAACYSCDDCETCVSCMGVCYTCDVDDPCIECEVCNKCAVSCYSCYDCNVSCYDCENCVACMICVSPM